MKYSKESLAFRSTMSLPKSLAAAIFRQTVIICSTAVEIPLRLVRNAGISRRPPADMMEDAGVESRVELEMPGLGLVSGTKSLKVVT
jgi:hypothetical protein